MTEDTTEATYDRYGQAYESWWAPIIRPSALRLLDRLDGRLDPHDLDPGRSARDRDGGIRHVVDIGTGTGTLALAALERWPSATVTGVDPSRVMLEYASREARRRGGGLPNRLRLERADADRLPLPDASVDLVLSSFVIQLVPSRAAALREMRRVLRPGGIVALTTWLEDDEPFEPEDVVQLAIDELDLAPPANGRDAQPYTSARAAGAEIRRAGFRDVAASNDWLEHRFTPRSYVDVVEHWIEDDVFAALSEDRRAELRARIMRGLEALDPEALLWRRPLVSVVARRP